MTLVGLFVALVVIALIVWAVPKLLAAIGVPPNVATVIYVGLVCLVVLWLISAAGYSVPGAAGPMKRPGWIVRVVQVLAAIVKRKSAGVDET